MIVGVRWAWDGGSGMIDGCEMWEWYDGCEVGVRWAWGGHEKVGVACETVGAFMWQLALVHDARVHVPSRIVLSLKNKAMEKGLVTYLKAHLIENQTHCVIKHTNPVCVCVCVCVCGCVKTNVLFCSHALQIPFHTHLFQLNSTLPSSLSWVTGIKPQKT